MRFILPKKLMGLVPVILLGIAGAAVSQLNTTTSDLFLHVNGPLTAGTMANAASTGSTPGIRVHLFNGSDLGSTSSAYGLLDVDNGVEVVSRNAGRAGTATFRAFVPARYVGLSVFLQAIDDEGKTSQVHIETIV